ncbi:Cyclophilin-like peptidyl-prolyl cis-trans isomerase domain-containing protein [Cynara cardunculus var. scolymus]|uniref:peptidylprolyl isomerase n=1 Tax=Cynara cardunculus var. scolymus TaxID=59895 RepID=A0A103Y4V5_CYNCS|nr:Cyclophilin-like peptidyl-prolyl cis-trans isomerase domain-containing protein [Cynara cardunculus var. scolymus]
MAAIFSCSSLYTTSKSSLFNNPNQSTNYIRLSHSPTTTTSIRRFRPISSSINPNRLQFSDKQNANGTFVFLYGQKERFSGIKECVLSVALAIGLITGVPTLGFPSNADAITPALSDLAVLISGPPIKDPGALLRYALPIDNKAIREVQKPLEDITESLKNLKQASRSLKQGKNMIIAGLAESKKDHAIELLGKLEVGMEELQKITEDRKREAIAPKQKELLQYVGGVEEDMVDGFPYDIPEEYQNMPLLKGRATVDMKVKVKDNPNLEECIFRIVLDADGFVVQTGDPEGPAEGFIDPSTEKTRTIPLEIMVEGEKAPVYGVTLEEFENNSASSQIFWLLKESELTPSNANILDGRYSVFGYVTQNEDFLADLKVGDVIESIQVVAGLDNLVNPSYKIAG